MTSNAANASQSNFMNAHGPLLRSAAATLNKTSSDVINDVLSTLADTIDANIPEILDVNAVDVSAAKSNNQTQAFIDRLSLDESRIKAIAQSVRDIAALPDPTGEILEKWTRPNGLEISKVSVPIGVLGIIYESRPNVTIDAAALCLKSHNAALLRGGSDSLNTSLCLHSYIASALKKYGLSENTISIVDDGDRAIVGDMLRAHKYIDVIVPRGGRGLIERIMNEATMPVFAHLDGVCHVYIDKDADVEMAATILMNAKLRRTGICGAAETVLFHQAIADATALKILQPLIDGGCDIVGDERIQSLNNVIKPATEVDWSTEYLDAKISAKYVSDLDSAISHINTYGSHHTDCIISENADTVKTFQMEIDSAIVLHNASTQFADGGEFGMGAEIGIGTGKLHARGPVGVRQLTTFKYLVSGSGQTRP